MKNLTLSQLSSSAIAVMALASVATSQWIPSASGGTDGEVTVVVNADFKRLYVGGSFTTVGGNSYPGVAGLLNNTWQPLPGYQTALGNTPSSMYVRPNGDLVVGTRLGYVFRWDIGSFTWQTNVPVSQGVLGGQSHPFSGEVNAVAEGFYGMVAGGTRTSFGISGLGISALYSIGQTGNWIPRRGPVAGGPPASGTVLSMATTVNPGIGGLGVVVGGSGLSFQTYIPGTSQSQTINTNLAFFDGVYLVEFSRANFPMLTPAITQLPVPSGIVEAMLTTSNGDLITVHAGPLATSPRSIYRWGLVGEAFTSIQDLTLAGTADGAINSITELPDGDLVVVGEFQNIGGTAAASTARLTGSTWSALGAANGPVNAVAFNEGSGLFVGGDYTTIAGLAANNLSRIPLTSSATVTSMNDGCSGAGGPNVLTATSLPWLGTRLAATATGMAPGSLAVNTIGLSFLGVPAPLFLPSCLQGASPDILLAGVPVGGELDASFDIADSPLLIGAVFHHQVACLELSATGSITGISTTNTNALLLGDI